MAAIQSPASSRDLVLLGAGHAHLEVLRDFARRPVPNLRVTVIAREPRSLYTGMLPGLIRGEYGFAEAHIDLAPLAAAAGATLVLGEASGFDPVRRAIRLEGLREIGFDLLSIDIGGVPPMPQTAGTPVRPIGQFLHRLDAVVAALPTSGRIVIVGGGAAGTELALAVKHRFGVRVTLVCAAPDPLPTAPRRAQAVARAALTGAGVELACGVRALGFADRRLGLSDGSMLEADAALWANGGVGPALLDESGLACDADGCVLVAPTLASVSHPGIFAAGDCASVQGASRPKAGIWAMSAGPVLADNLRRAAQGRHLRHWRPRRTALTILGLSDGSALAWRNGVMLSGPAIRRWKDRIDRNWMARYALAPRDGTPLDGTPATRQFRPTPPG